MQYLGLSQWPLVAQRAPIRALAAPAARLPAAALAVMLLVALVAAANSAPAEVVAVALALASPAATAATARGGISPPGAGVTASASLSPSPIQPALSSVVALAAREAVFMAPAAAPALAEAVEVA